ncbi:MAG TPA: porin, partial [Candidatus Brocadiia bacterium]|nr:porin [Candidatus Brocadiia bacterium]
ALVTRVVGDTRGPFTLQGEYIASMANRASSSNEDPAFDGWYVLGSWLITGETRPYDKANAIFKGVKPNSNFGAKEGHGWGAWELSARYQTIDLNKEDIKGGQLNAWTLGLNWYLNKNIKIMADYTLAGTDYPNDSGEQKTRNVGIFGMRFQAAF